MHPYKTCITAWAHGHWWQLFRHKCPKQIRFLCSSLTKDYLHWHDLKILSNLCCWKAWWYSFGEQLLETKFGAVHTCPASMEESWTKLSLQLCPGQFSEDCRTEQSRKLATVKDVFKESKPQTTEGVNQTRKDHKMVTFYTAVISLKQTDWLLTITKRQRTE